jgi:hypothetical protein
MRRQPGPRLFVIHKCSPTPGWLLGELGAAFAELDLPTIEVQLPRHVAELALAAWQRERMTVRPRPRRLSNG